jgi:hypothetical protein
MFLILTVIASFLTFYLMQRRLRRREENLKKHLEDILLSLEDKARKEGTFNVSYFDKKEG